MRLLQWVGSQSVRTQWIAILALYGTLLTVLLGTAAFQGTRRSVESDTIDSLESSAATLRNSVDMAIIHNRERIRSSIKILDNSCGISGNMNTLCASEDLKEFVKREHASGVVLSYDKKKRISAGTPPLFDCAQGSVCYYSDNSAASFFVLREVDDESGTTLLVSFPTSLLTEDVNGVQLRFSDVFIRVGERLLPVMHNSVITNLPYSELSACGAGIGSQSRPGNGSSLYRIMLPARVASGVCIVTGLSADVVLQPVRRLQDRLERLGVIFVLVSILLAWILSYTTTRPLLVLQRRVSMFKEGAPAGYFEPEGPAEVRELAQAFEAMSGNLRLSRSALLASERRLSLAYRAAHLWVWEYELSTAQITWKDPLRETENRSSTWKTFLRLVHPEDRESVVAALHHSWETGNYDVEYRIRKLSGYIWAHSWGQILPDSPHPALIGVTADITSNKEEDRLRAERERLVASTEMGAELAHEINNPLTSVTGAIYMARLKGISDAEIDRFLEIAESETKRIVQIVKRLLQVYRNPSAPTTFDVVQMWRGIIAAAAAQLQKKNLKVNLRAVHAIHMEGYAEELRHGFNNLLTNAIEVSPQESVIDIRVRLGNKLQNGQSSVRVIIADRGSGISVEKRHKVFEPFVSSKGERGVGLGLWVTRSAIVKQGGTIRMRSSSEKQTGTCIILDMPSRMPV